MGRSSNPVPGAIVDPALMHRSGNGLDNSLVKADPPSSAAVLAAFLAPYAPATARAAPAQWQPQAAPIGQLLYLPIEAELEAEPSGLWLVTAGQVRLLVWDAHPQKNVSIAVLNPGEVFGFEALLPPEYGAGALVYQAIAASDCQLLYLPVASTQAFLAQATTLQADLANIANTRSRLAFFRTQTAIAAQSRNPHGKILTPVQLQQVVPRLQPLDVAAGAALGPIGDRAWLVSGEVTGDRVVGDSWTIGPDDRAVTPVSLYQLGADDWAMLAALIPALGQMGAIDPALNRSAPVTNAAPGTMPPPAAAYRPQAPAAPQATRKYQIHFPKPNWGRYVRFDFPFIAQQSSSDCGITCLAMIGRHWGAVPYPLHQLREWAKVGRSGASLKNLATTAEKLGFVARPVRASLPVLLAQKRPWIAHWQGDHYVVVYADRGATIQIADPAVGKRRLSKREFMDNWSGYALTLETTPQVYQQELETGQKLSGFGRLLITYRHILVQIILISLLIQVFGLLTPVLTQIIFDRVVSQKSLSMLHLFSIGLLIFGGWRLAMTSVRQYLLDYFGNRLELTLVSAFIRHTLSLPIGFFEARNVGDIITRIQENGKIQQFLMRHAVATWLDALMGLAYLGLMFYYNAQLALLVLALLPPLILLTLVATPFLKRISREAFKASAEQTSLVVEMISGIAAVKTAAIEQEIRWRWEEQLARSLNIHFKGQKLSNTLQVLSGIINIVGSTALLWYGATLVIQGQITIGQLVAFNMLIGSVLGPAISVIGVWDEFQEVLISVERLNDVFATAPEESQTVARMTLPALKGEIHCDRLTFAYDGADERPILQGLDFRVNPGETVAIVGRSGSGKTTLIKLLQGFYTATQGRILVDGHDIQQIAPASLRSQLGVVPQDCFLFSGTILENIRLHRPNYPLETVVEVAKLAEAHHFIQELPLGYNTKVGERGANLSGGQRQRIAIARALLGNPGLLILDEATSALDTESERRFQRNLERISRDRTTFIIAHRLSTVQNADRILVLDRGLLVEQGNHAELLEQRGLYYHLAQQQLSL
jgi:ATP-binding cassette, subfamily B, bacterial HlyB/CyaB